MRQQLRCSNDRNFPDLIPDRKFPLRLVRTERFAAVADRPDDGSSVLICVARARPHHFDEIFDLAGHTAPHVLVAISQLRRRAWMKCERLRQV